MFVRPGCSFLYFASGLKCLTPAVEFSEKRPIRLHMVQSAAGTEPTIAQRTLASILARSAAKRDEKAGRGASIQWLPVALALAMACQCAFAADIRGTITVKQKLTRPGITAPVSLYERGPAVELGHDPGYDPLAEERARVVIWLESAGTGRTAAQSPRALPGNMRQVNRRFDPDIVVISAGGSVTFPNMDPIFHNVFSLSKPKSFDLGNYPKGDTRTVTFPKPGIVFVNCRLHPNMAGVVVVTPNQWYAKADRDGQYAIGDVPAGAYTVVAWHKKTGYIRREISVAEGRDAIVDFLVPIGAFAAADPGAAQAMAHMKMTP
jgi:plastocyanin